MSSEPLSWTVLAMLKWATDYFEKKGVPDPRLSIEWILSEVLSVKRLDLYMQFDRPLSSDELNRIRPLVKRRALNEPIQYIVGRTQFHSAEILVTPSVLIPRDETEQLVERLLNDPGYSSEAPLNLLDIGTGSGCIPIAIKMARPQWNCYGADLSEQALQVARENARINQAEVSFVQADFEDWQTNTFYNQPKWDIIISNPPYITLEEEAEMHRQVTEYEPRLALFHHHPLSFYEKLIHFAYHSRADLFLECNDKTANQVRDLAADRFPVAILSDDLDGNPRFVSAKFN